MSLFQKFPLNSLKPSQAEAVQDFISDKSIEYENIRCMVCNSDDHKILFKNDRFGIPQQTVMCNHCGLLFSNPRMTAKSTDFFYSSDNYRRIYGGIDDIAQYNGHYERSYRLKPHPPKFSHYYAQQYFDFLHSFDLSYETVCEVGAGGGWNLVPFQQLGKTVTGYEPSPILCELGEKHAIPMVNGFLDDVDQPHDLLILKHVLEHFRSPEDALTRLKDKINKYLFIEVPGIVNRMPSIQNAHYYYNRYFCYNW